MLDLVFAGMLLLLELGYYSMDLYSGRGTPSLPVFARIFKAWKLVVVGVFCGMDWLAFKAKESGEELRYVGSLERRTLGEWFKLLCKNAVKGVVLVLVALLVLDEVLAKYDLFSLNRRGVDKAPLSEGLHCMDAQCSSQLQLKCHGDLQACSPSSAQQPLVLYESGYYDSAHQSSQWIRELFHLGKLDRYCVYERPGLGLSTLVDSPASYSDIVNGVKYILNTNFNISNDDLQLSLVGYSQGALYARLLAASLPPSQIHSIMFVDGWTEEIYDNNKLYRQSAKLHRIIPRLNSLANFERYLKSFIHRFGIMRQWSWIRHWAGPKERIYDRDYASVHSTRFLRAKFEEYLTYHLLSAHDLGNTKEKLINTKISVVSSNGWIKANEDWALTQRELVKMSKDVYEWKVIDIDEEEEEALEVWEDENGKLELQAALLRLIGSS